MTDNTVNCIKINFVVFFKPQSDQTSQNRSKNYRNYECPSKVYIMMFGNVAI